MTSGTTTLAGYVNGIAQQLTRHISPVDSLGYAQYTASVADVASIGQFLIDAELVEHRVAVGKDRRRYRRAVLDRVDHRLLRRRTGQPALGRRRAAQNLRIDRLYAAARQTRVGVLGCRDSTRPYLPFWQPNKFSPPAKTPILAVFPAREASGD